MNRQMKKQRKRTLALLLAVLYVLAAGMTAFASTANEWNTGDFAGNASKMEFSDYKTMSESETWPSDGSPSWIVGVTDGSISSLRMGVAIKKSDGSCVVIADISLLDDDADYFTFVDMADASLYNLENPTYLSEYGMVQFDFADDVPRSAVFMSLAEAKESQAVSIIYMTSEGNYGTVAGEITAIEAYSSATTLGFDFTDTISSAIYPLCVVDSDGNMVGMLTSSTYCWEMVSIEELGGSSGSGGAETPATETPDTEAPETEAGEADESNEKETSSGRTGRDVESESETEEPNPTNDDMNMMILIVIVVIIAAVIVVLFVLRSKGGTKNGGSGSGGQNPGSYPGGQDFGGQNYYGQNYSGQNSGGNFNGSSGDTIGFGDQDLGGQVQQGTGAQNCQSQQAPRQSIVSVQGIAGMMAGRIYAVSEQGLSFGRDSSMNVRFSEDTKGVSRIHCRLFRKSGGEWMLMDCGSKYGTLLKGYGKLTPNQPVPVKKGDTFYLGSDKDGFTIQ